MLRDFVTLELTVLKFELLPLFVAERVVVTLTSLTVLSITIIRA